MFQVISCNQTIARYPFMEGPKAMRHAQVLSRQNKGVPVRIIDDCGFNTTYMNGYSLHA